MSLDPNLVTGAALDILASQVAIYRNPGETDAAFRERVLVMHLSASTQGAIIALRKRGWTILAPGYDEVTLEDAIAEANEAQTALELAEKLLAMRNTPLRRKITLREVAAFLGGKDA